MNAHDELKQVFADRKPMDVAIEINGFTGFRTTDLDDLTDQEAEQLLKIHCPEPKSLDAEYNALKEDFIKKALKSTILVLAEKTNIKDTGAFEKFNNWMLTNSKFKKHLNAHNLEELRELHKQMRAAQHNNAKSAMKTMTEAWWQKANHLKDLN